MTEHHSPHNDSDSASAINWNEADSVVDEYLSLVKAYESTNSEREHDDLYPQIIELTPLLELLAERLDPEHYSQGQFDGKSPSIFLLGEYTPLTWYRGKKTIHRLKGIIDGRQRRDVLLSPTGPQLPASGFHPWVWDAARNLWQGKHYKQAVFEAANAVTLQAQVKVKDTNAEGRNLYSQIFSTKDPDPGKARLRFLEYDQDQSQDTWKSAHEGAMHFGMGCALRIRNLLAHPDHSESTLTEQGALEYLAALSILARWIDDASPIEFQ